MQTNPLHTHAVLSSRTTIQRSVKCKQKDMKPLDAKACSPCHVKHSPVGITMALLLGHISLHIIPTHRLLLNNHNCDELKHFINPHHWKPTTNPPQIWTRTITRIKTATLAITPQKTLISRCPDLIYFTHPPPTPVHRIFMNQTIIDNITRRDPLVCISPHQTTHKGK